jgi:hypothetical protein
MAKIVVCGVLMFDVFENSEAGIFSKVSAVMTMGSHRHRAGKLHVVHPYWVLLAHTNLCSYTRVYGFKTHVRETLRTRSCIINRILRPVLPIDSEYLVYTALWMIYCLVT